MTEATPAIDLKRARRKKIALAMFFALVAPVLVLLGILAFALIIGFFMYPGNIPREQVGIASALAIAALIIGNKFPRVVVWRAMEIVLKGTAVALMSLLVLVGYATGDSSIQAVSILAGALALYVIMDSFFDDGGLFAFVGSFMVSTVVAVSIAMILADIPRVYMIPVALTPILPPVLAILAAMWICKFTVEVAIYALSYPDVDDELSYAERRMRDEKREHRSEQLSMLWYVIRKRRGRAVVFRLWRLINTPHESFEQWANRTIKKQSMLLAIYRIAALDSSIPVDVFNKIAAEYRQLEGVGETPVPEGAVGD